MNTIDRIPIDSVLPGDSPRFTTEDQAHIARLAGTDAALPPILVHRQTMRVIDGLHRLRAARLKGEDSIAVEFFDGTEEAAYLLSVQANIAHGLPLSTAERKAAAMRIVTMRPEMSDRSIARTTGLSAKTVAELRRRSTAGHARSTARVGRDGRLRPVNADEGRRRVLKAIRERPDASLREIAQAAGVSVSTAHGVRARADGRATGRTGSRTGSRTGNRTAPARPPAGLRAEEAFAGLESLRRDPSLRFTDSGRALLAWLHQRLLVAGEAEHQLQSIPPHLLPTVSALALECADNWRELATELRGRARRIG
ncbi:ParB/RepB/Spo0J family partition protein [Kitasatospora viridis]|uniref:ParB-like chromosome segregation protein Spo0J n=1 Tax=Kitasatospora viridis TaxID=281105 RepID=A0A561UCA7_9ACTN|nr:ParB/RepB/Spo0J family partition protein [Kitasatospora viridis]TWF96990.1 ParB-like chromosome segregation protein Spo0J [Kitasatospora viridis]